MKDYNLTMELHLILLSLRHDLCQNSSISKIMGVKLTHSKHKILIPYHREVEDSAPLHMEQMLILHNLVTFQMQISMHP